MINCEKCQKEFINMSSLKKHQTRKTPCDIDIKKEQKEQKQQKEDNIQVNIDLKNEDGAGYVGTIYLGSDETPANVLFDTGSDFLAVTSDLCLDQSLGK